MCATLVLCAERQFSPEADIVNNQLILEVMCALEDYLDAREATQYSSSNFPSRRHGTYTP